MQDMSRSWIGTSFVKHRTIMSILTTLALSVSMTGKSSRSSSSISSVAVGLESVYILYSGLKPSQHQTENKILNLFSAPLSPSSLSLSQFTACFVKIFDQTNKHPKSLKKTFKHVK